MINQTKDLENRRFPWALSRIDMAGMLGAVAAFFVMVLLSLVWGPLFLIGLAGLALVIFATRGAERAPPPDAEAVVSPVDGVVTSITSGLPPAELRLDGSDYVRVRIASAPTSTNTVHSPMAGEILSLIEEAGDSSVRLAREPDEMGLASAYFTIGSGTAKVGVRVVTGGLGPRLDIIAEAGDPVRVGREIGVRHLGGWCDVWLPEDASLAVWPGMTLRGAETRLVSAKAEAMSGAGMSSPMRDETVPFEMPSLDDEEDASSASELEEASSTAEEEPSLEVQAPDNDTPDEIEEDGVVKDASEQFERLRKKVQDAKKKPKKKDD